MSNAPAPLHPIPQSRGYVFHQDPHAIEQRSSSVTNKDKNSPSSKMNISTPVCRNCKTQTTPLWRRDETGQVLCNACGLFLKLHGRARPISLKTDVIKSRNRVKHSGKSHPNTPELKAKESVASNKNPKFSPKQYKPSKPVKSSTSPRQEPSASPALLPLLPRHQQQQKFIHPPHHLVQPLHYPSSTPAQFNNSLTAITSPLLLSTATPKFNPSQSSERGSLNGSAPTLLSLNSAASSSNNLALVNAAAGALENLANQEKPFSPASKPFSPASALQTPSLTSLQDKESVGQSPSFGPQFCLNQSGRSSSIPSLNINQDHSEHHLPSVRPLLQLGKKDSSAPPMSRSESSHSDDPNELKTRISELELVNDLYRTRIMELEAMEQAAKRRAVDLQRKLKNVSMNDTDSTKRSSPTNEIGNDEKRIKQEQYRD